MSFLSTYTGVALVNTSNNPGTITLPATTNIPNRQVFFKDAYGSLAVNQLTLKTAAGDTFEDGTTTKIFNNPNGFLNLYAYDKVWYNIGGTTQVAMSLSNLNVSSINNATIGGFTTTQLLSTIDGLGSAGYISSLSLLSTTGGITRGHLTAGYLSTPTLISTTSELQADLLSTTGGVTRGYLTSGYLSTLSLTSTTRGLQDQLVSTTGGLIELPELTSTAKSRSELSKLRSKGSPSAVP